MWILLLSIPYLFAPPHPPHQGSLLLEVALAKEKRNDHQHFRLATKFLLLFAMEVSSYLLKFEILHMNLGCKKSHNISPFYHDQFFQRMNLHDTSMMLRVVYFLVALIEVRLTTFAISTPYGPSSSSHSQFSSNSIGS
jgi:hypothetical protein